MTLSGSCKACAGSCRFGPVWAGVALVNMWVGVTRAGYSVAQEAPILVVVFGVPAALALLTAFVLGRG